ncbi:protein of unknown function [Chryseobacterium sp. JV274]|nr:protein of unknown function [Chryseobacterium sp. JV274]
MKKIKKIKATKLLMNKVLKLKTTDIRRFHQKNKTKYLRGIIKYYTFASL